MRRLLPFLVVLLVLGALFWTLQFLYKKSQVPKVIYETQAPQVADVVRKTVAPGAIVPRREVAIKPRVSGVLRKLGVEPGQYVKEGDLIAEIKIIPNVVSVNAAEARLGASKISLDNAKRERARLKLLFEQRLISATEYNQADLQYQLGQQEVSAARSNLQLVKNGAIRGSRKVSNVVKSTVEGMVIEAPVKEGASVIEANNFNEGTTIAAIADMNDMLFQGSVDESEVGRLKAGMPVSITVGALKDVRFEGKLEYISPKGVENEGTTEFELRAALKLKEGTFVRANYSANADIILERRDQVLSIEERLVSFEGDSAFVEVETAPQSFERRPVKLGLSDGIRAEVLEGLTGDDQVKVPQLHPEPK